MTVSLEKATQPTSILQQRQATWQDYTRMRDRTDIDWRKITFYKGWLWIDLEAEGLGHACPRS